MTHLWLIFLMMKFIGYLDGLQVKISLFFPKFILLQTIEFFQGYSRRIGKQYIQQFHLASATKIDLMAARDLNKEPTDQKIRRINQRKQRYKRSTNNSHKKFINIARRLLFKQCSVKERQRFQEKFQSFKNSRAYFFILLAHAKIRLKQSEANDFRRIFVDMVNAKMEFYQKEIDRTDNKNFINFRFDQIADMQFCLKACDLYFEGAVEEAIETIYKKQKITVLKKQHYEVALEVINELQKQLRYIEPGPLFPYVGDSQVQVGRVNRSVSRLKQELDIDDDSEYRIFVQREHTRKKRKKVKKYIIPSTKDTDIRSATPLLFLEKSYPIYPHFFSTIYSYDPMTLAPLSPYSQYNLFDYPIGILQPLPPTAASVNIKPAQDAYKLSELKPRIYENPVANIQSQLPVNVSFKQDKIQRFSVVMDAPKPPDATGTSIRGVMEECN